jgi:PAS domain S-box-containing protein
MAAKNAGDPAIVESAFRQHAEERVEAMEAQDLEALSAEELRQRILELRIREIELELENDALRQTHQKLKTGVGDVARREPAYEHLLLQHQFLRRILNSLTYPLYVIDAQTYTVEMANLAAYDGKTRGDLTCYALTHAGEQPCQAPGHICPLEEVKRTKEPAIVEHTHVGPDGRPRYVEVYGYPVLDSNGNVVQMIEYTLDITERKRAELALRESKSRWRSLTENSPDHIVMLDRELVIRFANFAAPGLTRDELIGVPLYTLVDEPRQAEIKSILEDVLRTGAPARYETVFHCDVGDDIYYELHVARRTFPDTGQAVGLTVSARDITDRKRAEQALRDSEAKLRALFEILPLGISVLDKARNIRLSNPAMARIVGLSEEQVRSGAYENRLYLKPDGTEMAPSDFPSARAAREQQPVRNVEIGVMKEDGELIWTSVSAAPLPLDDWHVIVTTADITRLKTAEFALQRAHGELEQRVKERTAQLTALNQALLDEIAARQRIEDELRTSEERFRQLAEHIDHVFWVSDVTDDQLLYISPAYDDLWGQSREDLYKDPLLFLEAVHPDDRQALTKLLDQGRRKEREGEFRLVRPDGGLVWVRICTFPIRDPQSRIYRIAGIAEDITDQVQAVQLLEQRVQERTHELSTLLRTARNMTLTLELGSLFAMIFDSLTEIAAYDCAILFELRDERLVALAYRGRGSPWEVDEGYVQLAASALARDVVAVSEPILIEDAQSLADDALLAPVSEWVLGGMAAPLTTRGKVVGVLALYSSQPQTYSPQQISLLAALASQTAVGIENARLYEQTRTLAVSEERQRLARDLHDAVSQTLFSANIIAEALPRIWDRDPESVRRRLPQLHRLTSGALAEMRALLLELRPTALVDVELHELLARAVNAFSARSHTVASLTVGGQRSLPAPVQIALYRIAQEALSNVAKHARAEAVEVHLLMETDRVELRVRDDGQGFELEQVGPACMGLNILRERARSIGAIVEIASQPGDGTEVVVTWTETQ